MEQCRRDPVSADCEGLVAILLGDPAAEEPIRVNGKKYSGKEPIAYVNGVWNNRNMAIESGAQLSDLYGSPVDVLWNPTGGKLPDLLQTVIANKMNMTDASMRMVVAYLRARLKAANGGAIRVVAHSQGAALFSSASSYLTAAERSQIEVTTYAGAAWTLPAGFKSERHVVNVVDPVPMILGKGYIQDENTESTLFFDVFNINHLIKDYIDDERFTRWLATPAGTAWREQKDQERIQHNWDKR